jgi:hypothetical protein
MEHPMTEQFDNTYAIKEGWCISEVGSDTPFRLEKYDEAMIFESDQEAWEFVYDMAVKGSYYHSSALAYLIKHSPKELNTIVDHLNGAPK